MSSMCRKKLPSHKASWFCSKDSSVWIDFNAEKALNDLMSTLAFVDTAAKSQPPHLTSTDPP